MHRHADNKLGRNGVTHRTLSGVSSYARHAAAMTLKPTAKTTKTGGHTGGTMPLPETR